MKLAGRVAVGAHDLAFDFDQPTLARRQILDGRVGPPQVPAQELGADLEVVLDRVASRTATRAPARWASSAVVSPTRPPPATARSTSRSTPGVRTGVYRPSPARRFCVPWTVPFRRWGPISWGTEPARPGRCSPYFAAQVQQPSALAAGRTPTETGDLHRLGRAPAP